MSKLKFYTWLMKFSKKKFREAHLDEYKNDIKCSGCNEWFSVTGTEHKHTYIGEQPSFGIRVKCGNCGHVSYWNLEIAPVAIECDKDGKPL